MTGKVYNDIITNDIFVETDNGETIWSTQTRPLNLLPDEYAITYTGGVDFPELEKGYAYNYQRQSTSGGLAACFSVATLVPGEYGPEGSGNRNLPDIVIGTVPAGVNYLDVRASLTRTVNPSPILGTIPVPSLLPSGIESFLPGGSCEIEKWGGWRKLFHIVLEGNQIILRRRISIKPQNLTENPPNTGVSSNGWTYRDPSNSMSVMYGFLESKLNGYIDNRMELGQWDQCSINTSVITTRSLYSGTITIRLGYIGCQGDGCAINGGVKVNEIREPVSGWQYATGGSGTLWEERLNATNGQWEISLLRWSGTQIHEGTNLSGNTTQVPSISGWFYLKGPQVDDFPQIRRFQIARKRLEFYR